MRLWDRCDQCAGGWSQTASTLTLSGHSHFLLLPHYQKRDWRENIAKITSVKTHYGSHLLQFPCRSIWSMWPCLKTCGHVSSGERQWKIPLSTQTKNVNRFTVLQSLTRYSLGKMPEVAHTVHITFLKYIHRQMMMQEEKKKQPLELIRPINFSDFKTAGVNVSIS